MSTEISDAAVKSAINFFCCQENSENICRLCLGTSDENISFEQNLVIDKPYFSVTTTFLDIFDEIGFIQDDELPNVFCNNCAVTVINAYLFNKLCEYSASKWTSALDKLSSCIDNTVNTYSTSHFETAYLCIDNTKTYTISNSVDKSKAASKLNSIIKRNNTVKNNLFNWTPKNNVQKVTKDESQSIVKIPCKKCAKNFSTKKQLNGHIERCHKAKTLQCSNCPKMFPSNSTLKSHIYTHHIPVTCNLCMENFPNRNKLTLHIAKHQTLTCPTCNKTYGNKNYYKVHIKMCSTKDVQEDETFYCDICNKGYARKNSLRSHLKVEHNFASKLYNCEWCNKKFDAKSRLASHIVKHTKERNYYCDICGFKFVTTAALVYHRRLHTGEKPFACNMCDESFVSASRRAEHKHRKHFGPQHACPLCPRRCVSRAQLARHEKRHADPSSKLYVPKTITTQGVIDYV